MFKIDHIKLQKGFPFSTNKITIIFKWSIHCPGLRLHIANNKILDCTLWLTLIHMISIHLAYFKFNTDHPHLVWHSLLQRSQLKEKGGRVINHFEVTRSLSAKLSAETWTQWMQQLSQSWVHCLSRNCRSELAQQQVISGTGICAKKSPKLIYQYLQPVWFPSICRGGSLLLGQVSPRANAIGQIIKRWLLWEEPQQHKVTVTVAKAN